MQYLPYYPKRAGSKYAIPETLLEMYQTTNKQYLPHYPECVGSKQGCHTGRPEAYGRAGVPAYYTGREPGVLDIYSEHSLKLPRICSNMLEYS
jgi:hypothetical protein